MMDKENETWQQAVPYGGAVNSGWQPQHLDPIDPCAFQGQDVPERQWLVDGWIRAGYQATLDAMAEPQRSAIRDGNFMAAREDGAWQVIPTSWVLAANERWRVGMTRDMKVTAMGIDVARGGRDETILAPRYSWYFAELTAVSGRETPDGPSVVALAAGKLRDRAAIGIDCIGIGADAETSFRNAGMSIEPLNGAERSYRTTRDESCGFFNKRSEMWYLFREALDPDYGEKIALPPDPKLQADLTAPTFMIGPGKPPKIRVEGKPDIIKRLGRSPDRGDAVVYSWAVESEEEFDYENWEDDVGEPDSVSGY
jgi:hypothetical protein